MLSHKRGVGGEGIKLLVNFYRITSFGYNNGEVEQAEYYLRKFYSEGRLEQPRLLDDQHYPISNNPPWVVAESDILWNK